MALGSKVTKKDEGKGKTEFTQPSTLAVGLPARFPDPKKKRRQHLAKHTSQTAGLLQCQSAADAPDLRVEFEAHGRPGDGGEVGTVNLEVRQGFP